MILLDPWSLTWAPAAQFDEDCADVYVEALTEIYELSRDPLVKVFVSDQCAELLQLDQRFPLVEQLPEPIWPKRSDVFKLVGSLLDRLPKFSALGISEVLIDGAVVRPEFSPLSDRHLSHLADISSMALVLSERSGIPVPGLLSCHSPQDSVHEVDAEITDVESTMLPAPRLGRYSGDVRVRRRLIDLLADISSVDLLRSGYVQAAISLEIWKADPGRSLNPFEVEGFALGPRFTESVGNSGVALTPARIEALLRACRNVVLRVNERSTHALREDESGASSQIKRKVDGALAWRMDVDYEYHLHYWSTKDGFEFSNVVVHNDFRIY